MHAAKRNNATEETLLIDSARSAGSKPYYRYADLLRLAGSGFLIGQSYIDP